MTRTFEEIEVEKKVLALAFAKLFPAFRYSVLDTSEYIKFKKMTNTIKFSEQPT